MNVNEWDEQWKRRFSFIAVNRWLSTRYNILSSWGYCFVLKNRVVRARECEKQPICEAEDRVRVSPLLVILMNTPFFFCNVHFSPVVSDGGGRLYLDILLFEIQRRAGFQTTRWFSYPLIAHSRFFDSWMKTVCISLVVRSSLSMKWAKNAFSFAKHLCRVLTKQLSHDNVFKLSKERFTTLPNSTHTLSQCLPESNKYFY